MQNKFRKYSENDTIGTNLVEINIKIDVLIPEKNHQFVRNIILQQLEVEFVTKRLT